MATYSKILELINGSPRTVDLSSASNFLAIGNLQLLGSSSGSITHKSAATVSSPYTVIWPAAQAASSGYTLSNDGTGVLTWVSPGSGSVTSVALALPSSVFSVSGSPVTSTGTLTGTLTTQTANTVWAGPTTGSAATPTFRALVSADMPNLSSVYANLTLSNLTAPTDITVDLLADTGTQPNLGSASNPWGLLFVGSVFDTSSNESINPNARTLISGDGNTEVFSWENAAQLLIEAPVAASGNGAASVPSFLFSGVPFTGGSTTTTLPQVLLQSGSPTSNNWSTSGTYLGINAISAFSGNLFDFQENAASRLRLSSVGVLSGVSSSFSTSVATPSFLLNGTSSGAITMGAGTTVTSYPLTWPSAQGGANTYLKNNGSGVLSWATAGTGTVTSVALADGSTSPIYGITGSPITGSGTLTFSLNTQTANTVFAGPGTGSAAQPTFRSLVAADIPNLSSTYVTQSEVGAVSGVASLDGSGHIPLSQLPASLVEYKGTWNASTNTPTLSNSSGVNNVSGYFFIVSTGGTVDFGAGPITFNAGDWVLYNGTVWEQAVQATVVQSVNGAVGVVTVNAINQLTGDVTASAASASQSKSTTVAAIQGTTVSGTTGTGNVVFSASPTLTGTVTAAAANFSGAISASNFSGSSSGTNTGDQTITLTGDVTGSGTGSFATTIAANAVTTTKINNAAVTAAKLGSVTDGVTLDQSGSGSTIEIKNAGVSATQLATGAFDQLTITGGAGTAASVAYSPSLKRVLVAGQTFTANTSYAVRWGLTANGETAGRVYAADTTTSSFDLFYCIGMASSGTTISAGGNITVTTMGPFALSSADSAFASSTDGAPVFIGATGTFSTTAPSASGTAVTRIGMVQIRSATIASNIIDVWPVVVGVN